MGGVGDQPGGERFSDGMSEVLTDLAEARGLDPALVLRRARILMAALDRASQAGRPLILRGGDSDERRRDQAEEQEE
ncbi:MAG TPA: hypothetical protein VGS28_03430 [Candidatus Saccharimonadales bacterium]|nr:hypothetical protein [Candidatus Saccharimonadales bacterium]